MEDIRNLHIISEEGGLLTEVNLGLTKELRFNLTHHVDIRISGKENMGYSIQKLHLLVLSCPTETMP